MAISQLDIFPGKHACPTLLQPLSFFHGSLVSPCNFGCATGHKLWGDGSFQCTKTRFDSGITLTSDESTAASFVNLCLDYLFPSLEANKQDPAELFLFYVDIFGRRIKFVLSSFGVCWTSVLSKGILVIS
jgi:hypothetical protein